METVGKTSKTTPEQITRDQNILASPYKLTIISANCFATFVAKQLVLIQIN